MEETLHFYQSLNALEKEYWHRLYEIFQRVNPQKPEKGIRTLITRARQSALLNQVPLDIALQDVLQGAIERTNRRVELLNRCSLKKP